MKKTLFKYVRFFTFVAAYLASETGTIGQVQAQTPTFQDCLGAIPVCLGSYANGNIVTGTGNIPNEINPVNSCLLTGERNDVWYILTTSSAGNLSFSVIPNNPVHNYDWAVYNLTSAICSDIFTNPSLEVSCNYNNTPGTTGANGLAGAQNNPVIPVSAGQTYLINVSAYSTSNQGGYTLDLTASTAAIADNTPPSIASVSSMNCGAQNIMVSFSEKVLCNTVQASDFTFTGPGGPYAITGVSSNACTQGAAASRDFTLAIFPHIHNAGTFTLTLTGSVTDQCGNNAVVPQPFSIPIPGMNVNFTTVDVTCFGGNNGSATASVTGATGPFVYQWSPSGGSSATAQWLTAGTYTVTVTSPGGCTVQDTVVISQPLTGMTASVVVTPANGCAANGTASVSVSNGQAPYTYSWWPSGGNASTATGLTAGGYMVTITDANQCALNYFLNVPSSAGPTVSIANFSNVSCFGGNDGSATVAVTNATGPFQYSWSPSGGTGQTATGLTAGNYTVSVIVAPGCTLQAAVTIVEPPSALSVSVTANQTSCGLNNGSITLNPSGGVPGYNYNWSPQVASGNTASNLASGNYQVTVTDANGCSWQQSIPIGASTNPVPVLTNHNNVSCYGLSDGSTGITVTGGTLPLVYLWSNGQTSLLLNNIAAGTYQVTVTDAAGCTAQVSDVVTQPAQLILAQPQVQQVLCHGDSTGSVSMSVNGGTGSTTWQWSNGFTSGGTLTNIPAGTYTATVTDQNGCTATQSATVLEPAGALTLTETITNTTCGNNDGSISLQVNGGAGPYTYAWNTGGTGNALTAIGAGIYQVTVTDQNGCTETGSYIVQASDAPVLALNTVTPVQCHGGNNGSAQVAVSGGQAPYTWSWSGGVSSGAIASGLYAGTYQVTVTDQTGCQSFIQVTITEPAVLATTIAPPAPLCVGTSTTLVPVVSGGTTPYQYQWSNAQTTASITVSPQVTTTYTLTVTDGNGCVNLVNPVTVPVLPLITAQAAFPDSVCVGSQALVTVSASGGDGNYSYLWSNGGSGISQNLTILQNTAFNITVTDGCSTPAVQVPVQIAALNPPQVTHTLAPQEGCDPLQTSFSIPQGWPSGYIYFWNFGDGFTSASPTPSHLYTAPGIYDVTLSVAYNSAPGCSSMIRFPASVTVHATPTGRFFFEPSDPTINHPEVHFFDRSTDAGAWWWQFGDGTAVSTDQNPVHTYSDTGLYVVVLRVENSEGCSDSVSLPVHVRDEMQVYLPNAFTPNGSGINDNFNVYGVGYQSYELTIYDRWGKLVHVSHSDNDAWDGTDMNSGRELPQGVYVYKITITDHSGNLSSRFSYITLLR